MCFKYVQSLSIIPALIAALSEVSFGQIAPKPLFRDPVFDGAADVSIIFDAKRHQWTMFYTNRRANLKLADRNDVSWVHQTPIGMAVSDNGSDWRYFSTAAIPRKCTGPTLWAPDIIYETGTYHLFLTVVNGTYARWGDAKAKPRIVHLSSKDLRHWKCLPDPGLGSNKVIDSATFRFGNNDYRMWFKDSEKGQIFSARSSDLISWTRDQIPSYAGRGEGPKVFRFQGFYWMIVDAWKGMTVLRSDDAINWVAQSDRILETPGLVATDTEKGQHADVVVNYDSQGKERAFIYYFVHQGQEPEAKLDPYWGQRTVIQIGELTYDGSRLNVDRNAPVMTPLTPQAGRE